MFVRPFQKPRMSRLYVRAGLLWCKCYSESITSLSSFNFRDDDDFLRNVWRRRCWVSCSRFCPKKKHGNVMFARRKTPKSWMLCVPVGWVRYSSDVLYILSSLSVLFSINNHHCFHWLHAIPSDILHSYAYLDHGLCDNSDAMYVWQGAYLDWALCSEYVDGDARHHRYVSTWCPSSISQPNIEILQRPTCKNTSINMELHANPPVSITMPKYNEAHYPPDWPIHLSAYRSDARTAQ